MKFIDTHCHITHTIKRGLKLGTILKHAEDANVVAMIDSPVYIKDYKQSLRFRSNNPTKIFVTLGVPPAKYHELDINEIIKTIRTQAEKKEIIAVGEVGLDYYWVKEQKTRAQQHKTFQRFIELANELQLPLVIHSRDAEAEAVKELTKAEVPVVMHSFAASVEVAKECIDKGYYISIPTCVTNRKKHRKLAKAIPVENLLTETDSPYLSPYRDKKRNEPAFVVEAVKEIAKLQEQPLEEVAKITFENACKVFSLKI